MCVQVRNPDHTSKEVPDNTSEEVGGIWSKNVEYKPVHKEDTNRGTIYILTVCIYVLVVQILNLLVHSFLLLLQFQYHVHMRAKKWAGKNVERVCAY